MTLNLSTPSFSRLLRHPSSSSSSSLLKIHTANNNNTNSHFFPLFFATSSLPNPSRFFTSKASVSESHNEVSNDAVSDLDQLDQQLVLRVAATAKNADDALQMIAENCTTKNGGVVSTSDCCSIISASLQRNNPELALSVFYAMRASFDQVGENGPLVERWKWSRPNAHVYTLLIQGLAASLRVSDALTVIKYICEVGTSPGEEVRFGKIVKCPSCQIAVAVAQPQQGIQVFPRVLWVCKHWTRIGKEKKWKRFRNQWNSSDTSVSTGPELEKKRNGNGSGINGIPPCSAKNGRIRGRR